ncbi:sensor histidine kinase [Salipaludibacillus daqingensis]|uniref:sensor histidine kinase n=1 Tax=Salipaludibacillus daqingensis TaxID=3041001 RepID=UPI00247366A8|nr:histidine kinase [Salipaludibacillus daqingensis]
MKLFDRLGDLYRIKRDTFTFKVFYKLLILVIIPNLILLGVVSFLVIQQTNRIEAERFNSLLTLKQSLDNGISSLLDETNETVNNIIIDPQIQETLERVNPDSNVRDTASFMNGDISDQEYISSDYTTLTNMRTALSSYRLSRGNIHSIGVVDLEENIYLSSTSSQSYLLTRNDLRDSEIFNAAHANDSGLIWSVDDTITKNQDIVTFTRKIPSVDQPQNIIGYAIVNLFLNSIEGTLGQYIDDPNIVFGIIDNMSNQSIIFQGNHILQNNSEFGHVVNDNQEALRQTTSFVALTIDHGQWYISSSDLDTNQQVFIGYNKDVMNAELNETKTLLYSGMFILVMMSLFISLKGAKLIASRLNALSQSIKKLGEGSLKERVHLKGKDELADIGDQFNHMAADIEQLLIRLEKEQKRKQMFELRVLEYQLNPHFLYNTLDSIQWLAIEQDQQEISEMVYGLSRLFQLILSKGKEMITIEDEFQMAQYYLNIQKIRYENRFVYKMDLDPKIKEMKISKLILQPMIENAIHHGIRKVRYQGLILISGRLDDDYVVLEVADNGIGMTNERKGELLGFLRTEEWLEDKPDHLGYGVKNIDSRLKLVFGDSYEMRILTNNDDEYTTRVQVRIHVDAYEEGSDIVQ